MLIDAIATSLPTSKTPAFLLTPYIQRRHKGSFNMPQSLRGLFSSKKEDPAPKNILTEEYLKKKPKPEGPPVQGDLAPGSLFEDEKLAGKKPELFSPGQVKEQKPFIKPRNPAHAAAVLDPEPWNREQWERKTLIREIVKRGRLTKAQILKRTERQIISKSHDFRTSVKKLAPLATQITGKTVEEAIIQMRFSKKKAAQDVREHLEHARNEAIVKRGMGLGPNENSLIPIKTKKGKRIKVKNLTTMYVEQAWCGKGLYTSSPDYRARGQVYRMKNRTTGMDAFEFSGVEK